MNRTTRKSTRRPAKKVAERKAERAFNGTPVTDPSFDLNAWASAARQATA